MARVVVIGGGWAGCAASIAAKKAGAGEVILLERSDMLLGTGLVGGIMRNNGRFTAAEEMIAMGGGELFQTADSVSRHRNVDFPGHKHAFLYDVAKIEPAVRKLLTYFGVIILDKARVVDVRMTEKTLDAVVTADNREFAGDVFVEATGTAGPPGNCARWGNGCVMCIYRCPTFGPRISIAGKAGVREVNGKRTDGLFGVMSGSCKLHKESLNSEIVKKLDEKGVVVIPVPEELQKNNLASKACQQYNLPEFAENIILLDTGHAKLMSPFVPLELLRKVGGLENARFEDPYSGGIGNSVRFLAVSPSDIHMKTKDVGNLFCAGEKAGFFVGHTEAVVTGTLAGYNAVRFIKGQELLKIPFSLACGDIIIEAQQELKREEVPTLKFTFSGAEYFQRMKEKGLYSINVLEIRKRVEKAGMKGIFERTF